MFLDHDRHSDYRRRSPADDPGRGAGRRWAGKGERVYRAPLQRGWSEGQRVALGVQIVLLRQCKLPGREMHHRRSARAWTQHDSTPGKSRAKKPLVARGALWSELVTREKKACFKRSRSALSTAVILGESWLS